MPGSSFLKTLFTPLKGPIPREEDEYRTTSLFLERVESKAPPFLTGFIFFLFLFFAFLIFPQRQLIPLALATVNGGTGNEEPKCPDPQPSCVGDTWTETQYRCASENCGATIQKRSRTCSYSCSWSKACVCTEAGWDCGTCVCGPTSCNNWSNPVSEKTCQNWEKCGSTAWSEDSRSCQCDGDCLGEKNLRVLDEDRNPFVGNIYLPFILDWDVEYPDQTDHFKLTLKNTDNFTANIKDSEFSLTCQPQRPHFCWLKRNTVYSWKIQPCCANGNCGTGTTETFLTNPDPAYQCINKPQNPRYFDNPNYPPANLTSEELTELSKYPEDIFLPVKLDWDDVENWGKEYGPKSYVINIENTRPQDPLNKTTTTSAFIPPVCSLKSGATHPWQVKACCTVDGQNCGPESSWSFNTNLAPELKFPQDPDWQGDQKAKEVEVFPIENYFTLDWCDVEQAEFYQLRIFIIENGEKKCHPWLIEEKDGQIICDPLLLRPERRNGERRLFFSFIDRKGYFTRDTCYAWEIATSYMKGGALFSYFSNPWKFCAIGELPDFRLISPENDPEGKTPVGLPVDLVWEDDKRGIYSFIYEVYRIPPEPDKEPVRIIQETVPDSPGILKLPEWDLTTRYKWRVKPCWDFYGQKCEEWSEKWHFKTTGAPPKNLSETPPDPLDDRAVVIPVTLDWEDVSGAGSYWVEIVERTKAWDSYNLRFVWGFKPIKEKKVELSGITLGYQHLRMGNFMILNPPPPHPPQEKEIFLPQYAWRVRTCADKEGRICGEWTTDPDGLIPGEDSDAEMHRAKIFKPLRLRMPINPDPEFRPDDPETPENEEYRGTFYTTQNTLSWDPVFGAKYYQYTIYDPKGREISGITSEPLIRLDVKERLINLGHHRWEVKGCLDRECEHIGWSSRWWFILKEPPDIKTGIPLIPCGRITDADETPWNELEPCQPIHLFRLLQIIINFVLWTITPLSLAVLAVVSGIMFYFAIASGTSDLLTKIKALWRAAGIGLAVIFLSWTIVNIFIVILGLETKIFGRWWEITF